MLLKKSILVSKKLIFLNSFNTMMKIYTFQAMFNSGEQGCIFFPVCASSTSVWGNETNQNETKIQRFFVGTKIPCQNEDTEQRFCVGTKMQKLSTNQRQGNLVPIFVLYLRKWLVSSGLSIYDFAVVSVFGFFKIWDGLIVFFKFGEGLVVFFKVGDGPVVFFKVADVPIVFWEIGNGWLSFRKINGRVIGTQ